MIRRREMITAGLGLLAAGTAEYLRPRRRVILLRKGATITDSLPLNFAGWSSEISDGLVSPDQAGKLAKTLYSETVQRIYHETETGAAVMVLAAYGDTQSDLLQLHRPESCYPAVGFTIASTQPVDMPLSRKALLPVRKVVAEQSERVENIVYWTRVGERLPQSAGEQRDARFKNALEGFVADGILMRCSAVGEPAATFAVLDRFVPAMLQAVDRSKRPALIGTRLAGEMA